MKDLVSDDTYEETLEPPKSVVSIRIANGNISAVIIITVELKNLSQAGIDHRYEPQRRLVILQGKDLVTITIDLGTTNFPFVAPNIAIVIKEPTNYITLFDLTQASFEDIMKEHWHPSIKLADIAEKTV